VNNQKQTGAGSSAVVDGARHSSGFIIYVSHSEGSLPANERRGHPDPWLIGVQDEGLRHTPAWKSKVMT
jgi:hypothetical protein